MSQPSGAGVDLDRLAPEVGEGIRLLPVVHERVELASVARAVLEAADPAAVAVELPTTLREAAIRAVGRLPRISLVQQRKSPNPLQLKKFYHLYGLPL